MTDNNTTHPPPKKRAARLRTLEDARRYLARLINEVSAGKTDPQVAGKLGYLVNILISCIRERDLHELEKRLKTLEEAIENEQIRDIQKNEGPRKIYRGRWAK